MSGINAGRTRKPKIVSLFHKQKGKCYLCGKQMALRLGLPNTATEEHVIPKASSYPGYAGKGKNIKAACAACNHAKADMDVLEFQLSRVRA